MICYNCNLTSVCKVFEMIINMSSSINIAINDCQICRIKNTDVLTIQKTEYANKFIDRSPDDLLDISAKIKNIEQNHNQILKTKTVGNDTKKTLVACTVCGKELLETDSVKCAICEITLCNNCATYSLMDNKSYCETCWDITPPISLPDLN